MPNRYLLKTLLVVASLFLAGGAKADTTVTALTAASALTGPELLYCVQSGADRKCTISQIPAIVGTMPVTSGVAGTLLFNNSSVLGGITNVTSDGTNLTGARIKSTTSLDWDNGSGTVDVKLFRDTAAILAQRNSTTAQTLRIYNTFTDASNYERAVMDWTTVANTLTIGTQNAGTGSARNMNLTANGLAIDFGVSVGGWITVTATNTGVLPNPAGNPVLGTASFPWASLTANQVFVPLIGTDATHTDATVCEDTTNHQLLFGSGAAGICLGTSSIRFKQDVAPLTAGLDDLLKVETVRYRYRRGYGDPDRELYGFTAEQMAQAMPELVGYDQDGKPNSVDWAGLVPVLVRAIQQQQEQIAELKRRVK